jgi:putative phosphoribosyl transferase
MTKAITEEKTSVKIPADGVTINGNMAVPHDAKGIVLFAHGSGSSRFSPRNTRVAKEINEAGMGTLLIDLLTSEEEEIDEATGQFRFDIDLLSKRLIAATQWLKKNLATKNLAVGYFGASTGAAAALIAAAKLPDGIKSVVSRGGRPDLASEHLGKVAAPTLFIVGGRDTEVIELNRQAMARIRSEKKLEIVPGATHLFEESGALEEVARLAIDWFSKYFG